MHANLYTASFTGVAITAAQDLFALLCPSTTRIAICRFEVCQYSDVGDAASEMLAYTVKRGATVAGSGGTAPTPANVKGWGRAAAVTSRVNDTTPAGTGTIATVLASAFNIQAGLIYAPRYGGDQDKDERITVEAGQRLVVSLDSVPADSLTTSGFIMWEELGLV